MSGPVVDPLKAAQVMALGEAGYPGTQIAERVGLAESSVYYILNRHGRWGEVADKPVFRELRDQQKAHLHAASLALSAKCLIQVDKTIDKASAYQAAGIYGLMRTHERLDAGEATQNISIHSQTEVTGLDKLCDMLSQSLLTGHDKD